MTALFYMSGFFGLLTSGCAIYNFHRDSTFVFALGCYYAVIALLYFVAACASE